MYIYIYIYVVNDFFMSSKRFADNDFFISFKCSQRVFHFIQMQSTIFSFHLNVVNDFFMSFIQM